MKNMKVILSLCVLGATQGALAVQNRKPAEIQKLCKVNAISAQQCQGYIKSCQTLQEPRKQRCLNTRWQEQENLRINRSKTKGKKAAARPQAPKKAVKKPAAQPKGPKKPAQPKTTGPSTDKPIVLETPGTDKPTGQEPVLEQPMPEPTVQPTETGTTETTEATGTEATGTEATDTEAGTEQTEGQVTEEEPTIEEQQANADQVAARIKILIDEIANENTLAGIRAKAALRSNTRWDGADFAVFW